MNKIQKKVRVQNRKKRILKTFIVTYIVLIVLFSAGILIWEALNSNPGGDDAPILMEEMRLEYLVNEDDEFVKLHEKSSKVNILVLGINGNLTDTIMLASFDIDKKHADIISIPRDTYFERDGFNSPAERKVNAAFLGNPVNTAKAVSKILEGIPINYYVIVNFSSIKEVVDIMGGVPMEIPFYMKYDDPYDTPPLHIDIPEGKQILDGEKAVQVLRFRHSNINSGYKSYSDADIGRIKAQQEFLVNAFKQSIGLDLPKIIKTVYKNVVSDMKLKTMLYYGEKVIGMTEDDISTYTLPAKFETKPPYYVYPDSIEIERMLKNIYGMPEEQEVEEP